MGRAFDVFCCDLLDELRNVNACGATLYTGRIIAEQTPVGFNHRTFFGIKRRMDVTEIFGVLLLVQFIVRDGHGEF